MDVSFAQARESAGLPPLPGAPLGPPVAGLDFVAPLVADPVNRARVVVPTAGSIFAQGLGAADAELDWRQHRPLTPVAQQGSCGGCWAVAVAGCLSDRQAVATGSNPQLSALELLACDDRCTPECGTCSPEAGFAYAQAHGLPGGKACLGLDAIAKQADVKCDAVKSCAQGAARVYAGAAATVETIDQIRQELAARGPVVAVYRVYRDFVVASDPRRGKPAFAETGGVYAHADLRASFYAPPKADAATVKKLGQLVGYHAVVIVGWGAQDVTLPGKKEPSRLSYWLVRNSWGTAWGDQGYFKCAFSSASVNQSLGMDVPVRVTAAQGASAKYGGVFFAPVQLAHGSALYGSRGSRRPRGSLRVPLCVPLVLAGAALVLVLVLVALLWRHAIS